MKAHYKRHRFDFYKPDGCTKGIEKVLFKSEKRTKKSVITYFALCLGDSIEVQYNLVEKGIEYTFKKLLRSGDSFAIDQSVD